MDAADEESCRPDFAVALYPGHLAVPEKNFALNPDIQVTSRTPPTFLLQAEDDPVDPVENSLVYYSALRKAGVPAEMHVFVKGGHAFGLRPTDIAHHAMAAACGGMADDDRHDYELNQRTPSDKGMRRTLYQHASNMRLRCARLIPAFGGSPRHRYGVGARGRALRHVSFVEFGLRSPVRAEMLTEGEV